MTYPSYNFNDPSLDYSLVEVTTKQMYADINSQKGCCSTKSVSDILCQVDGFLQCASIDGDVDSDLYNEERWEEDIKNAYELLKGFFRLSVNEVSPTAVLNEFPDDIIIEIERGMSYFSLLHKQYTQDLYNGCTECKPLKYDCLKRINRALDFKVELDEYDDIAKSLVKDMIIIIGDYKIEIPPTVYAGEDQSKTVGETGSFTAVATEGSSPIVWYSWTKISGGDITLTNSNMPTVNYSNFGVGIFVLQVTVTDENGLTGSDNVTLTATMNNQRIGFWGIKPTTGTLTKEQIEAGNPFLFLTGERFTIPYNMTAAGIIWFAYPSIEPTKNFYTDTINSLNKGWMLSDQDYIGATVEVAQYKYQESYYALVQPNPLRFSTEII